MEKENSIFTIAYKFLENNLDKTFYCEDFSLEIVNSLFNHITSNGYTKDDIQTHKEDLRRAIKKFFELNEQKVAVFFDNSLNIILKDTNKKQFGKYTKIAHNIFR